MAEDHKPEQLPDQKQKQKPGREYKMHPKPEIIRNDYKGSDKLRNKTALITGGDSGIGRSTAVHFAREGADIAIIYLDEDKDARFTKKLVEKEGQECLLLPGDIKDKEFCREAVNKTVEHFGKLNVLVNNAGEHYPKDDPEEVDAEQMELTFRTNIFSMFYLTTEAIKHMKDGDTVINCTSVTAFRGSGHLLDYSSTKGAVTSFTRSMALNLASKNIRVNGVAPGPIWTPLIPSSLRNVSEFGQNVPLGRPGQPSEVAPCFVFLACADSSYMTGQVLHPNGGEVVGG